MICVVTFLHHAKHPPETVDHKVVGLAAAHELQQALASTLQGLVLIFLERRHVAFRGVKYDTRRFMTPLFGAQAVSFPRESKMGAALRGRDELVLHSKTVAVQINLRIS